MTTTDLRLPGTLYRESQFQRLPDGTLLRDGCGPNMLANLASWARQTRISTVSVYQTMLKARLCDPSGASTINGLRQAASLLGLTVAAYRAYGEPWNDFATWVDQQLAKGYAVGIEGSQSYVLHDLVSDLGENANTNPLDPNHLRYHYFGLYGHQSGYYIAADGCNRASGTALQHYADATLAAAAPCAAIAIKRIAALTTTGAGGAFDDWCAAHDVTGALYASFFMANKRVGAIYLADPKHPNGTVLYGGGGMPVTDQAPADVAIWLHQQWQAAQKAAQKAS